MSYINPLNLSRDQVVCYQKRQASQLGPLFVSLNGDRRLLEPGRIRIDEAVYRNKLGDPKTATSLDFHGKPFA